MSNFDLLEFHRLAMADAPRLGAPHAALGSMVATACLAATAQKQRTIVLERRIEEQAAEITVANDRLRQVLDSPIDAWIAVDDQQTIVLSKRRRPRCSAATSTRPSARR